MDTKSKIITVEGIIIKQEDVKEYDKLLTVLTKELGKIKIYSFNSRRQKSTNISKTRIFCNAFFELKCVKNNYNLSSARVINSFDDISNNPENMIYGSYFLEIADFVTFENIKSEAHLINLVSALKALVRGKMNKKLISKVYELSVLYIEGLYVSSDDVKGIETETVKYTWDYVLSHEGDNLYNFNLKPEYLKEFAEVVDSEFKQKIDKKFKSIQMINQL